MTKETFEGLCKDNGVEVGDLPAFPPANMTDEKWRLLIVSIGNYKRARKMATTEAVENGQRIYLLAVIAVTVLATGVFLVCVYLSKGL